MKPEVDFERTEEQEKLLKASYINLVCCCVFTFVCVDVGAAINGEGGAVLGFFIAAFIDAFWIPIAYFMHEEANTIGAGCKVNFTPPEMREKDKNA